MTYGSASRAGPLGVVGALLLGATGCGGSESEAPRRVTVFVAASLAGAMGELAASFKTSTGGGPFAVELNVAASSSLREQILAGAPGDVFVSADASNMTPLEEEKIVAEPVDLATNRLQIAVPPGNPAAVVGLGDFADPARLIGLCAEAVPCGRLGRQVLADAGITPSIDTDEPDVRSLVTKVRAGELDAGIVYRSDIIAAGGTVEGIDTPAEANVTATSQIAVLSGAADSEGAGAFVAYALSAEGRSILASHGFEAP